MSREIIKGSTDQSVVVRIIDATTGVPEEAVDYDTTGLALWYRREGATKVAITPAALASLDAAHSDGGIEHIDDGYYRLDLPDAALATGVDGVMVGGAVTDMIVVGCYLPLVDARATAAALATVDTVVDAIKTVTDNLPDSGALLALANLDAAVSSRSSHDAVDVKAAIEVAGGHLALIKAVTDALTAAAAAKLAASAGTIVTGQAAAGTLSTTQMTTNLTEDTNDHYNGRVVIWTSGALSSQASAITDYDGAGKMLTFTAVTEAPTAGDGFVIV